MRDNGVGASVELRIPLFRMPVPGVSRRSTDGMLELVPFLDYGRVWRAKGPTPDPSHIYSIGAGLHYRVAPQAEAAVYVGHPLRDVPEPVDGGLQDDGVHFFFRVSYPW